MAYDMYFYIVLTPISTTSGLWSTGKTRKYHQIDVYIYQCELAEHKKQTTRKCTNSNQTIAHNEDGTFDHPQYTFRLENKLSFPCNTTSDSL